ncbi:hypothetical protein B0T13DRAFT_318897 [Neurospora crassa]|nr:hypothetical protein B0T13DRAFT_318897 [Neurospora crassa]
MLGLVKSWLHDYLHTQTSCDSPSPLTPAGNSAGSKLPDQPINVGELFILLLPRLVLRANSAALADTQDVTRGHTWAVTTEKYSLKLLSSNFEELGAKILLEDLAQTFPGAMTFTRQLGYRFVWIDPLCIIQDSVEDWGVSAVGFRKICMFGTDTNLLSQ